MELELGIWTSTQSVAETGDQELDGVVVGNAKLGLESFRMPKVVA